ncbi:hypothetical protein K7432_004121 [Basidiobolus ranarum]|uniref:Chitin-binding type-3 domain-containing protein n=1 Tax=Basidiobolus ranarum TaxID=34480 RepID=A0ABR2W530_9FUNG
MSATTSGTSKRSTGLDSSYSLFLQTGSNTTDLSVITMSASRLALQALALMLLTPYAFGHMEMVQPPPRKSKYNPTYTGNPDYDMVSPLNADKWPYPCRGYGQGGVVQSVNAGSSIAVKIGGSATHEGGHCQFAISYDDSTFVVLKDVYDDCLIASLDYNVQIPAEAPSGRATFAWAWINKVGNREYYMNCADIEIKGDANGSISGPKLAVANLPGYPTIPEFSNGGYDGRDIFENRPIVKITNGNGNDGSDGEDSVEPKPDPEPTESIKPTEPTNPIEPTEPTKPVEPTEPTKPVEPTEPSKTTEPSKPTPTTEVGSDGCDTAPAWNSGVSYNNDQKVVYNDRLWQAKWWTHNDKPGDNGPKVWIDLGACTTKPTESINPTTSTSTNEPKPTADGGSGICAGTSEWKSNVAYNGGNKVIYNNQLWEAKWWSQNDKPGNNGANVWISFGSC